MNTAPGNFIFVVAVVPGGQDSNTIQNVQSGAQPDFGEVQTSRTSNSLKESGTLKNSLLCAFTLTNQFQHYVPHQGDYKRVSVDLIKD